VFFIELPKNELSGIKTNLVLQVFEGDDMIDEVSTNFMGPAK